jgi:hypothetical protein
MESGVQRAPVDVGPPEARPGLALALAILSIPGSTLAWDLPAGGLWIGLPLAIAAIVLGVKARNAIAGGSTMATVAILIAGLMIAQMAVWTIVSILD